MDTAELVHTPRVFVTNYAGHNYNGAKRFGELVSMTKGYVSFESLDRVKYNLFEFIVNETHKDDWLLLSGIVPLASMATALWLFHHKQVKLLIWDRKSRTDYREVIINEENVADMLKEMQG